jgi:hypothetical protein
LELGDEVFVMKSYQPYENMVDFCKSLVYSDALRRHNLILGGDLKFTLSTIQIWGSVARVDPLEKNFVNNLEAIDWVDIYPIKISLTWMNLIRPSL